MIQILDPLLIRLIAVEEKSILFKRRTIRALPVMDGCAERDDGCVALTHWVGRRRTREQEESTQLLHWSGGVGAGLVVIISNEHRFAALAISIDDRAIAMRVDVRNHRP